MSTPSDPSPSPAPTRILVAGVSGSGKTTLARRIAARLALPHTEIDALFHGPDWTPRPSFDADVLELVSRPGWVTEWQYSRARPVLAARAELLVWLDLPFRVALARVIRRTVRRARTREVLWNGNVEPGIWHAVTDPEGVVRWAVATRRTYAGDVPRLETANPGLRIVRLRSQRDVDAWLASL